MKKLLLIFLLGLSFTSIFGQYKFSLEIRSKSLSNKKISLFFYNNKDLDPIKVDTFRFVNGHHIINGEVKQPSNFAAISVSSHGKFIERSFVLDSGKNHLNVEYPNGNSRDLNLKSDARCNLIYQDLDGIFVKAVANYDGKRVNGFIRRPPELDKQINKAQLERIQIYPNDFSSLLYLYLISRIEVSVNSSRENLATFDKFNDNLKNTLLGKQLYRELTELIEGKANTSAGSKVPIFQTTDIQNKKFSNSSLKGQPYLIVFSATWCLPCQEALPKLKKFYNSYKQKGLKIVYFNNDDNVIRWKEHVSKNKLTWINVSEKLKFGISKIPKSFGVYALPTYLIIDKSGYIIYYSDQSDPDGNNLEVFLKKAIID